jgi:sortase A
VTTDAGATAARSHEPAGASAAPRRPLWSRIVGGLGEVLLTLGAFLLLFVAWQVWWVTREATSAAAATVDQLQRQFATPPQRDRPARAGRADRHRAAHR